MELNQLFTYFDYSPYLAFFGKMLNILSTFMWSYMDLFVMVVSIGLSTQFKKINRHLMKYKGQVSIGLLLQCCFRFVICSKKSKSPEKTELETVIHGSQVFLLVKIFTNFQSCSQFEGERILKLLV